MTSALVAAALRSLPTADVGDLDLADLADLLPCWTVEPDLFFADDPTEVERAKALCAGCPVRDACLAGALARREPWGVWGGEWFDAGAAVTRKRPRGRPRKDAEPIRAVGAVVAA